MANQWYLGPPWSWQSCHLNQPTGDQCSPGAVAGFASAGVMKRMLVAFAGTEPCSTENFKPPCFPNVLVLFRRGIRAVGEYLSVPVF